MTYLNCHRCKRACPVPDAIVTKLSTPESPISITCDLCGKRMEPKR